MISRLWLAFLMAVCIIGALIDRDQLVDLSGSEFTFLDVFSSHGPQVQAALVSRVLLKERFNFALTEDDLVFMGSLIALYGDYYEHLIDSLLEHKVSDSDISDFFKDKLQLLPETVKWKHYRARIMCGKVGSIEKFSHLRFMTWTEKIVLSYEDYACLKLVYGEEASLEIFKCQMEAHGSQLSDFNCIIACDPNDLAFRDILYRCVSHRIFLSYNIFGYLWGFAVRDDERRALFSLLLFLHDRQLDMRKELVKYFLEKFQMLGGTSAQFFEFAMANNLVNVIKVVIATDYEREFGLYVKPTEEHAKHFNFLQLLEVYTVNRLVVGPRAESIVEYLEDNQLAIFKSRHCAPRLLLVELSEGCLFDRLPDEVLIFILAESGPPDFLSLMAILPLVCQRWKMLLTPVSSIMPHIASFRHLFLRALVSHGPVEMLKHLPWSRLFNNQQEIVEMYPKLLGLHGNNFTDGPKRIVQLCSMLKHFKETANLNTITHSHIPFEMTSKEAIFTIEYLHDNDLWDWGIALSLLRQPCILAAFGKMEEDCSVDEVLDDHFVMPDLFVGHYSGKHVLCVDMLRFLFDYCRRKNLTKFALSSLQSLTRVLTDFERGSALLGLTANSDTAHLYIDQQMLTYVAVAVLAKNNNHLNPIDIGKFIDLLNHEQRVFYANHIVAGILNSF